MKKKAFTLAEALIALCIIGVVVALLLRTLNRVTPNKEKVMFVKAYHALEQVVADTINDPNKYDQEFGATTNADFSQNPLSPDGSAAPIVITQGQSFTVTSANALCVYSAEKLNVLGTISCGSGENFTTSNGIIWSDMGGGSYPKTIKVDVNGTEAEGVYSIIVYADGKMSVPVGGDEEKFLRSQTKIR